MAVTTPTEAVNRQTQIGFGLFLLFWFFPFFGFIGDVGNRVKHPSEESIAAKFAAWVSVIFHAGGAVLLALNVPWLGIIWGIFAAGVVARRFSARHGLKVTFQTWAFPPGQHARIGVGVGALLALLGVLLDFGLLTGVAVAAYIALAGWLSHEFWKNDIASAVDFEIRREKLEPVFGGSLEFAGFTAAGERLVIDPVPSVIAIKFDRAVMDVELAKVYPNLEILEESGPLRIVIDTATSETIARRQSLAATGGMIAGVVVPTLAPIAQPVASVPSHASEYANIRELRAQESESGDLILTADDLY